MTNKILYYFAFRGQEVNYDDEDSNSFEIE